MNLQCVLQIEDDENDILLLKYAFKQLDVKAHLHALRDGNTAFEYLQGVGPFADREQFPFPGLVLLDLKLPGISGLDVLHWIRSDPNCRNLPVVIFTSSSRPEDIHSAYREGANAYVVKPPSAHKLFDLVRCLNDFWLHHNQYPDEPRSS